jgi:hypothetical protein
VGVEKLIELTLKRRKKDVSHKWVLKVGLLEDIGVLPLSFP